MTASPPQPLDLCHPASWAPPGPPVPVRVTEPCPLCPSPSRSTQGVADPHCAFALRFLRVSLSLVPFRPFSLSPNITWFCPLPPRPRQHPLTPEPRVSEPAHLAHPGRSRTQPSGCPCVSCSRWILADTCDALDSLLLWGPTIHIGHFLCS